MVNLSYIMKKKEENNLAFVDGQNLYMGTRSDKPKWSVDLARFRLYLKKKYNDYIGLKADVLNFATKSKIWAKVGKGNVDTDIVFNIMKRLYKKERFDNVILVSGDGDYSKLVDFLIEENKFKKILFPNKKFASSLYKKITRVYFDYKINIKHLIENKKKGPLIKISQGPFCLNTYIIQKIYKKAKFFCG